MKLGKFYSPAEIAEKAIEIAMKEKVWRFRISGCETILGEASTDHFCGFIDEILQHPKEETFFSRDYGIMLGKTSRWSKSYRNTRTAWQ
jgi:uncharacterized Fe-S cluster-containing radical SAM superfamily protein